MWHGENLSHTVESFFSRLDFLRFIIFVFLGFILSRIIMFQIIKGDQYRTLSETNRIIIYPQPASRGIIYDKNMDTIVNNKPSFTVLFSRQTLTDTEVGNVITNVSKHLSIPTETLLNKINLSTGKNFSLIKIAEDISKNRVLQIAEKIPQLPGVVVRIEPVRVYKWGNVAAHITGYVREVSLEELTRFPNMKSGDLIGKDGIEREYDEILRGVDGGSQVEVNAHGIQKRILETVSAIDGNSIVLTIDKKIQNALAKNMEGRTGVAIAIDPYTGGILGLYSSPSFEPNAFISKSRQGQISSYLKSNKKPLLNRALQCQYPPASVYKMVTAFAGLENGVINSETIINCPGFIELGKYKKRVKCWAKNGHGNTDIIRALAYSCDVFFYEFSMKLGPTKLKDWAERFGFGKKTGIDLPSEEKGLIPDKTWKKNKLNQDWYDGDTVNMSIGQGYIWTTPMQIAQYVCAVANNGILFRPFIVKKIINIKGETVYEKNPQITNKLDINTSNYNLVKQGLIGAIHYGTGKNARIKGLSIAGKTGTAQNPQGENHSWFVCYAPVEKPKIALVVFIEHGGSGSTVAAPITGKMLADIFDKHPETTVVNEKIEEELE
ncbi:MAG: penicillin-binding protein 2 [Elusimicrobia bacterium RIFOXYD2_FULL_34_30]|nr:MAG: penicillin-binding protein 2 [Elusimicrobia bacterium RIFOXYD2_FULL_34_30]